MNKDIINLIHNETLSMYRARIEVMEGYLENSDKTILLKHPMLITVQESEMYIDPFMVLSGKLYSKWWTKMMPLFHKFLDDLSENEYQILEKEIDKEFEKRD
jgi:hypothetical protein